MSRATATFPVNCPSEPGILVCFSTPLGWMAMIGAGRLLRQLTLGHSSPQLAAEALDPTLLKNSQSGRWNAPLRRRFLDYASGKKIDFRPVPTDLAHLSDFQESVIHCCRQIPYGETLTYGQLAAAAGSPRAARAVGNCMAANRFPLVVPCHRVLAANGRLGGFSAAGGIQLKKRLLALESRRMGVSTPRAS